MAALTDSQLDELTPRLAAAGVTDLRPLPGGASSLTFAGVLGAQRVVVKVAPPGVLPTLNRDVLRQARIIRALGRDGGAGARGAVARTRANHRRYHRCS